MNGLAFWGCNSVIVDLLTFPKRRILLQGKQILVFKCGLDFGGATLSWIEQQEFTNVLLFFSVLQKWRKKHGAQRFPYILTPVNKLANDRILHMYIKLFWVHVLGDVM